MSGSSQKYGVVTKTIHWVMALLILGLLSVGFYMHGLDFSPFKFKVYGLHKSFGIIVLGLAALRLIWNFSISQPGGLASHQKWEKILAKLIKVVSYVALFAMPISGWLMSSAGGFPASFFGLFELPALVEKDKSLFDLMREVHEILGFVIIGVVGLHMAGALKHHLIDRDETFKRMTSNRLGVVSGLFLGVVLGGFLILPLGIYQFNKHSPVEKSSERASEQSVSRAESEGSWVIQFEDSSIGFEVMQYGAAFTGRFERFDGEIIFDPENLDGSVARINIDIASIKTGSDDRDGQARGDEWFDVVAFPRAQFVAQSFESLGANRYLARGDLTIRGVKLSVDLPFSLEITNYGHGTQKAKMSADLTLNRLDFGIGQGQWASTEVIGNAIKINIELEALQITEHHN